MKGNLSKQPRSKWQAFHAAWNRRGGMFASLNARPPH
jgi:hypothetical protein